MIGLEEMQRKIQSASREMQARISDEVQAAGKKFVEGAKKDLIAQTGDAGNLVKAIKDEPVDLFNVDITANKFYAAFIEFGTKGHYRPIPGTEGIAAEMKGYKRGSFKEMVKAIKAWVLRKQIVATYNIKTRRRRKDKGEAERAEQAAWAIAISLARHGMKPKPFFFKQIPVVKAQFQSRVKQIISGL